MFSHQTNTNQTITKPINFNTHSEKGHALKSHYVNLPNKKVLFVAHQNQNEVIYKIFSLDNLNTSLAETTLNGVVTLLSICPDGSILLNRKNGKSALIKLCPYSLNILCDQPWKGAYTAAVIDNQSFFVIRNVQNGYFRSDFKSFLYLYKWNGRSYEESKPIDFIHPQYTPYIPNDRISKILSLGKNRYCFTSANNKIIIVLEINPTLNTINIIGEITFKRDLGFSSTYDSIEVTPHNQLLTYRRDYKKLQIWIIDAELNKNFCCIKEWDLEDSNIKKPANFFDGNNNIILFPDSINILIYHIRYTTSKMEFFLFNTAKNEIKQVEVSSPALEFGYSHVLQNGNIIFYAGNRASPTQSIHIEHCALKEIIGFREAVNHSQNLSRFFLKQNNFPAEIIDHIFSYAFTPEAKLVLAKKLSEKNHTEIANNTDNMDYMDDNEESNRMSF